MGQLYDNAFALSDTFKELKIDNVDWWRRMAFLLGNSLNLLFYKPKDYDPYRSALF